MKKYLKITLLVVIAIILVGTFVFLYQKSKPKVITYETVRPEMTDLQKTTVATGKVEPRDEILIKPQISGIIDEVYKEAGQAVRKGEVIAKVKVIPELGQLNSAESRVRLAEINATQAETDFARVKKLYDGQLISREEYEKSEVALKQAREERQTAKDNLEIVKETYTDEALELMRDHCSTVRDLAIIDLLASSGMRVGEMVTLNREDINFNERECVVFGKGNKERLVYFDARTKIHLQNYLDERADSNPALFVTLKVPHERLMIGGVETMLRELGRRLNLNKVHPHKFRRTLATSAIDKGMPIEQVQQLLGHQKIDTTMHYAMVKQQNVKLAHRKFIG